MRGIRNYKPNPGQVKLSELLKRNDVTRLLAVSGARSGKTFEFIRSLFARSIIAPGSRHAAIRKHFGEAKKFIWLDTIPKVIDICFPELKGNLIENKSDYYIKFPNDSELWIGGLDDKSRADKILGGEYNTLYFNEISEISYSSIVTALTRLAMKIDKVTGDQLVNKAYFDENPPLRSHWSYKLFFEKKDPLTNILLKDPGKYSSIRLRPEDNMKNLPEQYIEDLKNLTGAARLRFYEGEFQDAVQGALWKQDLINKFRVSEFPDMKRIVIAIDPAITAGEQSNETGIVVVGLGVNNHIYVFDDISGIYTPNVWGSQSVLAFDKWEADAIVGEVNQGGDMVEATIRTMRPMVPFIAVRATRGKIVRAEPVAALYERGLVHHVGQFVDLEYQMTTYIGERDETSPDRMDALVWGITELIQPEEIDDTIIYDEHVRISTI